MTPEEWQKAPSYQFIPLLIPTWDHLDPEFCDFKHLVDFFCRNTNSTNAATFAAHFFPMVALQEVPTHAQSTAVVMPVYAVLKIMQRFWGCI